MKAKGSEVVEERYILTSYATLQLQRQDGGGGAMQDRLGLGRSPIEFDHLHHHPGLGRERDSSKFCGSGSLATRLRRVDGEGER